MTKPTAPERLPLFSPDLAADRLARLRELLPGAFAEGKLVPEKLAELVGAAAISASPERYGLSYAGRAEALREMLAPSPGTLRPERDKSVAWDATENVIIEGDNLHVLKLLQSAYAGAVKLIYIDPPYNTGNDFVYPDDFRAGVKHYKELTQQTLSTNAETSGRYHSDWLKMMHPRLALARNLLRDDGVIFVSIDDHEVHNLRLLMDEVFGEENFCGQFVWEKKKKPSFLNANMGIVTEHVVSYARYRPAAPAFTFGKVEDGKKFPFNNAGNAEGILTFPSGSVRFGVSEVDFEPANMSEGAIKCELLDRVEVRGYTNVQAFRLRGEWRYSQAKLDEFLSNEDEIYIAKAPFRPNYINREDRDKKCKNLLSISSGVVGTYEDATAEMVEFFGIAPFEYTKPSNLLLFLVQLVAKKDDLILDFFAGSGTTAQAVLELNRQDGGNRKFILVQFPEPTGRADFPTIADITRERVRRVIARRPAESQLALQTPNSKLQTPNSGGLSGLYARYVELQTLGCGLRAA